MRMSEKCRNSNNSDNPLNSRRTNGDNNKEGKGEDDLAQYESIFYAQLRSSNGMELGAFMHAAMYFVHDKAR